jgi:hypothetical protein
MKKLEAHGQAQRAHRELYYANQNLSKSEPSKFLTIIHDKMDHSKTACLHFSHKNKAVDSFMKLPVVVTGMIAHGHGDVRYAYYGLDIYPSDSNHTVGSIAKLLRDLDLLQCIQLSKCLLEVAHLLCFKRCSLGLLERLPTRAQIPVNATRFRFSTGCLTLSPCTCRHIRWVEFKGRECVV